MAQRKCFLSTGRLLAAIFIAAAVILCTGSPDRVLASGAGLSDSVMEDEVATFDEEATFDETATFEQDEEASFETESVENTSSLLHSEHYHAPAYFPDRLKRTVTSHPWMRLIPFGVLAVLAFVTTRGVRRRRQKKILPVESSTTTLKKVAGIGVWVFVIVTAMAGLSDALVYSPVKDAVVSFLGEGQKIYQTSIQITPEIQQTLKTKLGWEPSVGTIKVYYNKTEAGAIDAYAFVLSDRLALCGGVHKYCIKVTSDGQVQGVKILELTCDRSYAINTRAFLKQFTGFNTENADHEDCDGISGATLSTDLTMNVVRRALALFDLLETRTGA